MGLPSAHWLRVQVGDAAAQMLALCRGFFQGIENVGHAVVSQGLEVTSRGSGTPMARFNCIMVSGPAWPLAGKPWAA